MSYFRSEEVREKQSRTMKEKVQSYDWTSLLEKRKATIEKNNIKVGYPKGTPRKKTGTEKQCIACTNTFYVTKCVQHKQYCSRKCMYADPVYLNKLKAVDRSYLQAEAYKQSIRDPNMPSYRAYANRVRKLTEENYVKYFDLINPNAYKRTICGVDGGYQLDHIKSIKQCYNDNLTIEDVAAPSNLQVIPWRENLAKRTYEKIKDDSF